MAAEPQWKVAAIINEFRLAISAKAGELAVGDKVEVFEPGPAIKDPGTKEIIGHITLMKARLRVVQIFPRFVVASTDEFDQVNMGGVGLGTAPTFGGIFSEPPKYENVPKKLNIRPEDAIGVTRSSNPIVVGDSVRLVSKAKID